jgi:uncharacterized membrane protein YhaH (DUF805 family)
LPDPTNFLDWAFNALFGWLIPLGATLALIALAGWVLAMLLVIVPTWRICTRAGFSGALSLLHLVPVVGTLVVMAILAFSDWPNGEARR